MRLKLSGVFVSNGNTGKKSNNKFTKIRYMLFVEETLTGAVSMIPGSHVQLSAMGPSQHWKINKKTK